MATLKGQNFRILTFDSTSNKFKCIGMATSCTISLTNNTEDGGTKDDVGLAQKPVTTSKSWQVQVESLNVADMGALLTAVKNMTKFSLLWDETSTSDNQAGLEQDFSRVGQAYLSDLTLTFNDRENSAKSIQFVGVGAIEHDTQISYETVSAGSYTKGQFVRLFLSSDNTNTPSKVIAAAKQLSLHCSLTLEDSTTKDTSGEWTVQEATALSYDISTSALVRGNDTISTASGVAAGQAFEDIEEIYEAGTPVKWLIANVSGANQRVKGSTIVSGSAVLTSLQVTAANRQTATYQASLNGYGAYTVGS